MGKHSQWADEGTDPGIPGSYDDEIEEISADELGGGGGGVALGDPSALAGGGSDKTMVASVADLVPPGAEHTAPSIGGGPMGGDAERTMITAAPTAPQKTLRGKLTIIAGKEQGKVIELRDGSQTMGRSKEADVCLLDIQVSRKHCELVADNNGVLLRDLGSGNGTMVNGRPITETRLVHGDEVEIGDHVLRFDEQGPIATALAPAVSPVSGRAGAPMAPAGSAAAGPMPSVVASRRARRKAEGGNQKKKLLLVAGIAAIVVVGVGLKMAGKKDVAGPAGAEPSQKLQIQKEFRAGLDLFKVDKYPEALAKFEQVLAADPRHVQAKKYIDATNREMAATKALAEGNRLLRDGDFGGAAGAFARVPSESLKYAEAERGLNQVKQVEADKFVEEGEQRLLEGALADARMAFDRALGVLPGHSGAIAGMDKVQARESENLANARMTEAQRRAAEKAAAAAAAGRAHAAYRAELAPGEAAFDKKEFNSALSKFEGLSSSSANPKVRSAAAKKAAALKAFKPAYDKGMAAVKARKADEAVKSLNTALSKAKVINEDGKVYNEVQKQLSDMLYLQGRVAFNADRYGEAYSAWAKALRINPGQSYAKDGLRDLKNKGKELYLEGYTQKTLNRGAAVRKFNQVVSMTPSDYEYHIKAKQQLESLAN
ncbi:MAG: FHA domain-containing protein [Deltaproteobacteria bacterium]|nr:FHA domain-containing protein [Deltaproteobacteria bacterium]